MQNQNKNNPPAVKSLAAVNKSSAALGLSRAAFIRCTTGALCLVAASTAVNSVRSQELFAKPAYLKDLSLEVREGYDDNVLGVSRVGMPAQPSWITTVAPRVVFDLAPLVGKGQSLQTASFAYTPDFNIYHDAATETYFAHRFGNSFKVKTDVLTLLLDNSFLYNSGSDDGATYALNQTANQNDKNRSFFAQAIARERRKQIQDRGNFSLQYDFGKFFVRPTASTLFYDLGTSFHNSSIAPYKGYQNWPSRYDVNGGLDLGYKVVPDVAVTLGYRYGHQYQQEFPAIIDPDNHTSGSDYQRLLLGVEGKPASWLTVKVIGGPDFRDYGTLAAVNDHHPIKYFGEASITGAITPSQSVTFAFKQWQWVSSTGKVPYFDSSFSLNYHWAATKKLGLDLGGKILEADFTSGNDGTTSLRDDRQYSVLGGVKYAFNQHISAGANYEFDMAGNVLGNPGVLAPAYRDFRRTVTSVGIQYKF